MWTLKIPLISAAVALFCVLAAHRLSLWRDRRSGFAAAGVAFLRAITPELALLESKSELPDDLSKFLLSAFPRHREAFEQFSPHLSILRRWRFNRVWHKYHSGNERVMTFLGVRGEGSYFSEYAGMEYTEGSSAEAARYLAAKRLRELLAYADE